MDFFKRNSKRILTDAAGYALIVLGLALVWAPGPLTLPPLLAGLGLLSINNRWAARLRQQLLDHGGKLVKLFFPANPVIQLLYDIVVVLLLVLVGVLVWHHAAVWQISLAVALFFIAVFVALMNRDRLNRLRGRKDKP
jgi:uncharacterized membrane protein